MFWAYGGKKLKSLSLLGLVRQTAISVAGSQDTPWITFRTRTAASKNLMTVIIITTTLVNHIFN